MVIKIENNTRFIKLVFPVENGKIWNGNGQNNFGEDVLRPAQKFIETGNMTWDGERLRLTREGKLLADGIAAELFIG